MDDGAAKEYIESIRGRLETREIDSTGMVIKDFSKTETCHLMPIMDESRAKEIISNMRNRYESPYCDMNCGAMICMDGDFTSDELEAIAWWMENKNDKN